MKHIKIVQPGFEGYNGPMGIVEFVDGVSVEPVPRLIADRISSSILVVEIDEEGAEVQANPAVRIVGGATLRADVVEALRPMSEEDALRERRQLAERAKKPPVEQIYTSDELKAIADKGGIKALRPIGDAWGVRGRAISELIKEILAAQGEFTRRKDEVLASLRAEEEALREQAIASADAAEREISETGRVLDEEPVKVEQAPEQTSESTEVAQASAETATADETQAAQEDATSSTDQSASEA